MGECLVLIPGLLSDETAWAGVRDRLGQGTVCDVTTQASLGEMAADILVRHPGVLAVAGHSMGARVALEIWRQAPARVARLALLDTGIHAATEAEKPARLRRIRLAHEAGMAALCEDWLPPMVHPDRLEDAGLMAPLRRMVQSMNPDIHERQIGALLARPGLRTLLPAITCKVLVAVGRQDRWSPVDQHMEIASLIANARLVVIEDAGHFAPAERPDQVADAMRDWLTA
ncbi:MAG: alpha/beta fold hydrolase [Rhodobacteraceae bacterium]|nr:alpha/beta fold hydrolase [Paracoccaceae bacterium]